jgi:hypothetical protein
MRPGLRAMTDDPAAAVIAGRRQAVNRTLETIERVADAIHHDIERTLVIVVANLADTHGDLLEWRAMRQCMDAWDASMDRLRNPVAAWHMSVDDHASDLTCVRSSARHSRRAGITIYEGGVRKSTARRRLLTSGRRKAYTHPCAFVSPRHQMQRRS